MPTLINKTVILAAGDYPTSPAALEALASARHIVCCDSAAVTYERRAHRTPDAVVGDLDSLPASYLRRHADIVVRNPGQADNDLAKAFALCMAHGWRDIIILGATGRREDHTIGNIAWLAEFAKKAPKIAMLTDHGIFTVVHAPGGAVSTEPGMQISFFGFDANQRLTADGVVFPVKDLALRRWFTATLNEATGRRVRLSFSGAPVIVFREIPR